MTRNPKQKKVARRAREARDANAAPAAPPPTQQQPKVNAAAPRAACHSVAHWPLHSCGASSAHVTDSIGLMHTGVATGRRCRGRGRVAVRSHGIRLPAHLQPRLALSQVGASSLLPAQCRLASSLCGLAFLIHRPQFRYNPGLAGGGAERIPAHPIFRGGHAGTAFSLCPSSSPFLPRSTQHLLYGNAMHCFGPHRC